MLAANTRWRAALAGSALLHIFLFLGVALWWNNASLTAKQPVYVEVTMAELFSPLAESGATAAAGGSGRNTSAAALPGPAGSSSADLQRPAVGGVVASSDGYGNVSGGGGNGSGLVGPGGSGGIGSGTGPGNGGGPTRGPRVIEGGRPEYPELARSRGWEGTVRLQILVSAEGRVEDVKVVSGSGHGELDAAARQAVREWRFAPAVQKGSPIAAWVTLPVVFGLR